MTMKLKSLMNYQVLLEDIKKGVKRKGEKSPFLFFILKTWKVITFIILKSEKVITFILFTIPPSLALSTIECYQ